MRVLLGRPADPTYGHRTASEDCGREVYLGDGRQAVRDQRRAVKDRQQPEALIIHRQTCDVDPGDLRVLR